MERWNYLNGNDHPALFLQKALKHLDKAVSSSILSGDALDVDSTGFQPFVVFVDRHLLNIFLIRPLCLSTG